ncbi:MAG: L,D-transpeptidase family protein [Clostridium sp.]|uniref:L,D-transpeptidase family protein n=1 Tax=Clostridium sp. TaxID=1506 RepID=UPI003D6CE9CA
MSKCKIKSVISLILLSAMLVACGTKGISNKAAPSITNSSIVQPVALKVAYTVISPPDKKNTKRIIPLQGKLAPKPKEATIKPTIKPVYLASRLLASLSKSKSDQAVVIKVPYLASEHATAEIYSKVNKAWKLDYSFPCVVGRKGVSAYRHEGDMTTPEGVFGFVYEFGTAANPGTKMPYKRTQSNHYWSALQTVKEYNTLVLKNPKYSYDTDIYENLSKQPLYKYSAVVDFNYGKDKVLGKGSGIFLHIAPKSGRGTAGCIALKEANLVTVLKWLNPELNPRICIGTSAYFSALK